MSSNSHTPGPWRLCGQYNALKDEVGAEGRVVATVWTRQMRHRADGKDAVAWPEGEANVSLIVAAPALLEALRAAKARIALDRAAVVACHTGEALDADGQEGVDEYDEVLAKINAAIAKATGERS